MYKFLHLYLGREIISGASFQEWRSASYSICSSPSQGQRKITVSQVYLLESNPNSSLSLVITLQLQHLKLAQDRYLNKFTTQHIPLMSEYMPQCQTLFNFSFQTLYIHRLSVKFFFLHFSTGKGIYSQEDFQLLQ